MSSKHQEFLNTLSYARTFENTMPYPTSSERRILVAKGRPWPKKLDDGKYVYVLMPNHGEIRFSELPRPKSVIHHPELANGYEVIGAGLFTIANTIVTELSNESGHYMPDAESMYYVKLAFFFWGAPLGSNLNIDTRWEAFS